MKNIIIFGAPGSGKGTYSDEIVAKYNMGHISTGDVLREQIKAGTELGKTAQGYIDNGQLLPDELMIDILADAYDKFPAGKGVSRRGGSDGPSAEPRQSTGPCRRQRGDHQEALCRVPLTDSPPVRMVRKGRYPQHLLMGRVGQQGGHAGSHLQDHRRASIRETENGYSENSDYSGDIRYQQGTQRAASSLSYPITRHDKSENTNNGKQLCRLRENSVPLRKGRTWFHAHAQGQICT